ncbi:hypothetical protein ACA910_003684 [Epithemia clementina (nom. ined.)]
MFLTLSQSTQLFLIVVGLASGTIAMGILTVWLLRNARNRRQGNQQEEDENKGTNNRKKSKAAEKSCNDEDSDVVNGNSTDTGDDTASTVIAASSGGDVEDCSTTSSSIGKIRSTTPNQSGAKLVQAEYAVSLFPVPLRNRKALLDSALHEDSEGEEAAGWCSEKDDDDEEEEDIGMMDRTIASVANYKYSQYEQQRSDQLKNMPPPQQRKNVASRTSAAVNDDAATVRSAAELAAAWKLKAWAKELDSLAFGAMAKEATHGTAAKYGPSLPHHARPSASPGAASATRGLDPRSILCGTVATASCMQQPVVRGYDDHSISEV